MVKEQGKQFESLQTLTINKHKNKIVTELKNDV